jgi:hypothetical protein
LPQALRQLLWMMEAMLAIQLGLGQTLTSVFMGRTVSAEPLSQPTANERCALRGEGDSGRAFFI